MMLTAEVMGVKLTSQSGFDLGGLTGSLGSLAGGVTSAVNGDYD